MADEELNLSFFDQRIQKLEKQLTTYKIMAIILIIVGLSAWVVVEIYDTPVTVKKILLESQEVKLVDADGNTRFFLRLYSEVPILQLLGNNGKPRLSLGLRFDDTPFIDLSDETGATRAVLEMTKDNEPTLRMIDSEGIPIFKIN